MPTNFIGLREWTACWFFQGMVSLLWWRRAWKQMGKTWIASAHLAPVLWTDNFGFRDRLSLSPAVLTEPWCCCEAVSSDQFEAVTAEQGTCGLNGPTPLPSSHTLGVWFSAPLEEDPQESTWFSYRLLCVCVYVYVVFTSYVFNFYQYL